MPSLEMLPPPQTWYWLHDNGSVFSGPLEAIVDQNDPGYIEWIEPGRIATPWPRDTDGNQTNASLQEVLQRHGMFVDLSYYSISVRDRTLVGGITVNGKPFATDPLTLVSLNAAFIYTSDKQVNEYSWKLPDGTFITLDTAEIKALQNAVAKLGEDCYDCEATLLEGMDASTVTTREQVDAAYGAIQTDFTTTVTYKVRREKR
jgi:hypothetical protein